MTMKVLTITILGGALVGLAAGLLGANDAVYTSLFVAWIAIAVFVFVALPDIRHRSHTR